MMEKFIGTLWLVIVANLLLLLYETGAPMCPRPERDFKRSGRQDHFKKVMLVPARLHREVSSNTL